MNAHTSLRRRLVGAAVVTVIAGGTLTGCVLAPVMSTFSTDDTGAPRQSAPAQDSARGDSGSAPQDAPPQGGTEMREPSPERAPDGAQPQPELDEAWPDADESVEQTPRPSEGGVFGPPRPDEQPTPRVTVRIDLPDRS